MGISKTRTSAERQNRTLQDILSTFVFHHFTEWDQWLDPIAFAYNTRKQESTGYSTYEMVFGRTPRMSFEIELGIPLSNPSQHADYTRSTRRKLQAIHTIARANLENSRKRQDKRNAAQHPCWKPFPQGQAVWLKRPKKWKLGTKWVGSSNVLSLYRHLIRF